MKKAFSSSMEGDRGNVLHQMKVRTSLKNDLSWINQNNVEDEENGELQQDLSRFEADTTERSNRPPTEPSFLNPSTDSSSQRPSSSSGYIIRGVFTKTSNNPPSSASSAQNGYNSSKGSSDASQSSMIRKPSSDYKKLAPYNIRFRSDSPTSEEFQYTEEHNLRSEAANSVLKNTAPTQRSYVMSAAKKYSTENTELPTQKSPVSFVAKRVEINDDDPNYTNQLSPRLHGETKSSLDNSDNKGTVFNENLESPAHRFSNEGNTKYSTDVKTTEYVNEDPSRKTQTKVQTTITTTETLIDVDKIPKEWEIQSSHTEKENKTRKKALESALDAPSNLIYFDSGTESPATERKTKVSQITRKETESDPSKDLLLDSDLLSGKSNKDSTVKNTKDNVKKLDITQSLISFDSDTDSSKDMKLKSDKPSATTSTHTTTTIEKSFLDSEPVHSDTFSWTSIENSPKTEKKTKTTIRTTETIRNNDSPNFKVESFQESQPAHSETYSWTSIENSPKTETKTKTTIRTTETVHETPAIFDSSNMKVDRFQDSDPARSETYSWTSIENSPKTDRKTKTTIRTTETFYETPGISDMPEIKMERTHGLNMNPSRYTEKTEDFSSNTSPSMDRRTYTTIRTQETVNETPADVFSSRSVTETVPAADPTDDFGLMSLASDSTMTPTDSKKGIVLVKQYVNQTALSSLNTKPFSYAGENMDFTDTISSNVATYVFSSPRPSNLCTYCGLEVGNDAKLTIEHLNIYSHPGCFKCEVCGKLMGDLLESMFIHKGMVHCDVCYDRVF
ncbi:zinc finger protein 185 isoform X2 [Erpetoichthys calabaricus]|uniref:zinc finger protein 185 isoform X2 n=1 Tax=Erpetoichthys calabaricus TaxID=27687 RepID=UPI0022342E91|nr:zinc finger protein 185 isoform X2 [Erpetoichthys calabaricus]